MKTSDFYYNLPEELIAQTPIEPRDSSRLLVYNRQNKTISHEIFHDIINHLTDNDVLVINNTRVVPARLFGVKKDCTGKIEILLLKRLNLTDYEVLVKPARRVQIGAEIIFSNNLSCKIIDNTDAGGRVIHFNVKQGSLENALHEVGEMPLPHYIKEKLKDPERYQTVYSKVEGSAAAPTAGLHFTTELLERIRAKGVKIEEVMLHVGLGTFRPVQIEDLTKHKMHSEHIEITADVAKRLNEYKKQGKRIIAVGTTSVRTLESATNNNSEIEPVIKETDIFIYPPYKFKFVDALITNFHLPESTLIMLVSSFATREEVLGLYETAVKERYRFFSFGDSMMIE
ncbi:MAG: tRNA preQ1(34) S-adenosylmethionine ribosyltransferase-isomerase QueA [Clostridia bacterium]